jgi:hypothetical protein
VKVSEVLKKARAVMEQAELCKGHFGTDTKGRNFIPSPPHRDKIAECCTAGAFYAAVGKDRRNPLRTDHLHPDGRIAMEVFAKANRIRTYVFQWNDKPGRTKDDVLRAFDKAIDYAKKQEAKA